MILSAYGWLCLQNNSRNLFIKVKWWLIVVNSRKKKTGERRKRYCGYTGILLLVNCMGGKIRRMRFEQKYFIDEVMRY
jgi:hypothetical protein